MIAQDEILSLLENLAAAEYYHEFLRVNGTKDFMFIRPSGNPIDVDGLEKMTLCGDVIDNYSEIIDIQKLEFFSDINAMCVFSMREHMEYKEINNDDLAIYTSIFKKVCSKWKISFMHRSSGNVDLSLWTGFTSFKCLAD
jgi:hypothetical protein